MLSYAHNYETDACTFSSARAGTHPSVMTVAATDGDDKEAAFSNYGRCVDIWAPRVDVPSTRSGGGTTVMSGTSMATPHVGGTATLYLSNDPGASPAQAEQQIKADAASTGTASKDGAPISLDYAGAY